MWCPRRSLGARRHRGVAGRLCQTITIKKLHVAIAVLAVALIAPATALAVNPFKDVPGEKFYAAPVDWAYNNNLTTGSPAGSDTFKPEDPVTRGENITFQYRYHQNIVQPALDDRYTKAETDAAIAAATLGFYTRDEYETASNTGYYKATAWCDPGDVAVGGGIQLHANSPDFRVIESMPASSGTEQPAGWTPTGWQGEVWLGIDLGIGFWAYRTWAVCADVAT